MQEKSKILKDWLKDRQDYYQEQHKKTDNILDNLQSDGAKQILGYLERNGFEKTKEWVIEKHNKYSNSYNKLGINLAHIYLQVREKIWSIEKKEARHSSQS